MRYVIFIIIYLTITVNITSQVAIGKTSAPASGALLQLKESESTGVNSTRGLAMPRIKLTSTTGDLASSMGAASGTYDANKHIGLIIYNTGKNEVDGTDRFCPGLHVWDGTKWKPLIKYAPITQKSGEYTGFSSAEFIYMDPTNTIDISVAKSKFNKNLTDYPIAEIKTATDQNGNSFIATRYYVGYYKLGLSFQSLKNFSCDANNPNFVVQPTDTVIYTETFEDGTWMSENLKATTYAIPRDNAGEATSTITKLGDSEILTENDISLARWGYPNKDAGNNSSMGLLYTWAGATNNKKSTGVETNWTEGEPIQGICPSGWHLPSDRQWTDLENGIILKTSLFANTTNIGTKINYWMIDNRGKHSRAIRNTSSGTGSNQGYSKVATDGGFDSYDSGFIDGKWITYYGSASGWWTASANGSNQAQRRFVMGTPNPSETWENAVDVFNSSERRYLLMSVRCMINTD